ncbi:MATE family efflux transporter [Caproicibacterium lactatifermentans]|uniref:Probable multidrug resistance protein NorM n=2 Tax=Oscillospiraceae TaxID=216572 RepID=A0A859DSG7_9FIRM|nr:MATE family efflux transporter [Caproicibacterium lactatifermentans]QKO31238.1 MATE family efflux transporter [Caproicibacterium lactatifermentans]
MTSGNPQKLIIQFAVPIFLSQLFQQLYNTVDSVIVGNYLGKSALAAVSSSGTLIFLLVSFFTGMAMGAGVAISKYFGAGDQEKMSKAIHTNVAFGVVAGILLTIVGIWATPEILRWMGTDPRVLPQSIVYFRYYFCGALSIVLYNIFTSIMNAVGDSKRPLYYLIFSSILNVVLDLLFICGFHLGVGSAAVATTISQTVSMLLSLYHLTRKGTIYQVSLHKVRFHTDTLREMIHYGIPTGIQNSVIGFANVIVQTNINSFGENAMAGYGSYIKIEGFAFLPITCFAIALSTFVSQNLGAGKHDRAKTGARFGILTSILLAEGIGVIIFCSAPFLISLFNQDSGVIAYGVRQAHIETLFYFVLAFSHCIAGICRGAGKAVVPMLVMLGVWCVFRIFYISVAMHFSHNITLVFWAYPLTWSISSAIFLIYYKKSDWVHGFDY